MIHQHPLNSKIEQFTQEVHNLQKKCEQRPDVNKNDLNELTKFLKELKKELSSHEFVGRRVASMKGEKSVEEALKAILFTEQMLPAQTDAKAIQLLFTKLFHVLSGEMRKIKDVEKKDLEKLEKKLARRKRPTNVEKSHESNALGK